MRVTSAELRILCQVAHAAGQEIMAVYQEGGEIWHKEDASPLTEADLRADRVIRSRLQTHFPDIFILSEESVSEGRQCPEVFFLVDPLDGTKEFLKRNDEFTVNIALVVDGRPTVGVVFAPALNELYYAAQDLGAWKQDATGTIQMLETAAFDGAQPLRVMGSRSHGGDRLNAWLEGLNVAYTFIASGSSLKFCRIAEGQADIYPRFGPTSQWDTAAAHAILAVAGGMVTNMSGSPLLYGLDQPILNPEFIAVGGRDFLTFFGI